MASEEQEKNTTVVEKKSNASSSIERTENGMAIITIKVPQDEFADALNRAFKKNAKRFAIPGFRKGKAPMKLVTNYYGEGILYDDAFDLVANDAYQQALKDQDEKPYSRPNVNIIEIGSDKGVTFTAEFALKPEVKLGQYEGLTAYKEPVEVTDEEVEQSLKREQEKVSRMVPVTDRPVEEGDTVNIDYKGSKDGVAFEGGTGAKYDLVIGSNSFIPGFEDQLIGHETGETFTIDVTFPEEYHAEDLKGQAAQFEVTINEIKFRELPELDDEFVKDVSEECDTLDEFKAFLRKQIADRKEKAADAHFVDELAKQATENAEMEIPHIVIHEEMERMMDEQSQQMMYQGLQFEDFLKYTGMDRQTYMMQLHAPAEERLRTELVIDAIAQAEKVELAEEDFEKQFADMAEMYGQTLDQVKKTFDNENMRDYLKEGMLRTKVLDLLKSTAIATDVKPEVEEEKTETPVEEE